MSRLSLSDRLWRALACRVDRLALRWIGSQRVLRALFALSAYVGGRMPSDVTQFRDGAEAIWLYPKGVDRKGPVLMYIHGGGFTLGSPQTHAALAAHLARASGLVTVLPRYRLAPEHPYPAARADVIAAYDRLVAKGRAPVALAGDSAGGNLALLLAQHLRDHGQPLPRAMVLIAPVVDLSGDIAARFAQAPGERLIPPQWARRIRAAYLAGQDGNDPTISPLAGDLGGLPPTLIQAGAEEVLAQDAKRLATRMTARLDLWPEMPHVWHLHAGRSPAADRALGELGKFLKEQVAR